jgi:mannose-6-phosphate isomerase-like protein (cupin superfamily)
VQAHSLAKALEGLDELEFGKLGNVNGGSVGVYWSTGGTSPWELHPEDDELLYVIEGGATIEILTETDRVEIAVPAGSCLVVPGNHWHRHKVDEVVKEMYVTPGPTETSFADDPRI